MAQEGSNLLSLKMGYEDAKLRATILNSSESTIHLFDESNSWGSARWRIIVIRDKALLTFYQNPDQSFTANVPTTHDLRKGESKEITLDLSDGNWRGIQDEKLQLQKGDIVVVIYDVPVSDEARKYNVWYGIITARINI